jgi:hypothetical protein
MVNEIVIGTEIGTEEISIVMTCVWFEVNVNEFPVQYSFFGP